MGCIPWNKGLTKFTDERIRKYGESGSKTQKERLKTGKIIHSPLAGFQKGKPAWNKGLTKDTNDSVRSMAEKMTGVKFSCRGKGVAKPSLIGNTHGRGNKGKKHSIERRLIESQKSWNKGLTKETDERVRLSAKKMSHSMKALYEGERGDELRKRSRENRGNNVATINERIARGEWHTSLAKRMHINYNGIDLHGTWELKYAQYLDANGIKWERNRSSFPYFFEDAWHRYFPDFYLIDTDEYIEIKGQKTKKDDAKWNQFPKDKKLIVLQQKELKEMKIL